MNTIQVGVCGWGDHDLYPKGTASTEKLPIYAQSFPVVELDSIYHAIPAPERMEQWASRTPESFRFVIKAYRELTGHGRPKGAPERSWDQLIDEYREAILPMKEQGKCQMLLFQFPPWYDCSQKHVRYLRRIRQAFPNDPVAIEFRNQSWFLDERKEHTLDFLKSEAFIHVICDEPQAGDGSIPRVMAVTNPNQVLIRFHGRNVQGWNNTGKPNWRDVRYAYRYNKEELSECADEIKRLKQECKQMTLLFNNNSQGDAVGSAKLMVELLGLEMKGLSPRQLGLFE
ncbi:Uncharacterized conserved protein YecE, DUF72 family [Seinonella peptonophila]|uniref:Uncharacterized conserved protein YecE, DUF72 family n=1 Tax=Seinonella peptonophila TaxID=112248 RepID=A0A1M4ZFH2_9BACL|nr:DUF72 domain-containing protein [Seinonella peptonophila]SHF16793.1 Uncharacterized conserved protein YecE, DUF72 family [Seinonella peptonophila]